MDSDDEFDFMANRAKNMAEINNMFGDLIAEVDGIMEDAKENVKALTNKSGPRAVRKRKNRDEVFKFAGTLPLERRKSARLSNSKPKYSYADLEKLEGFNVEDDDTDYFVNLEDIIREPREKRKVISHRASLPPILRMPEEITEAELNRIATKSGNKTYSQLGTSCHQCRQKTIDTKTTCRSGRCIGVRGQFCGPCLKNRYGEDAREALLDPEWACPPCRNLCNCSICRTREGKRPTGILAPTVQQEGFSSVKDFLLNLAEKGILSKPTNKNDNSPPKNNMDDVISNESSKGVIDALMNSYVKKIKQNKMAYEATDKKAIDDLLGFVGGTPVYSYDEDIQDGELLGFNKSKTYCCMLSNDVVYHCLLF